MDGEISSVLNIESVPVNHYRTKQNLERKCKHICIYIICTIPLKKIEKNRLPWNIVDVFEIILVSWAKNKF